MQFFRNLLKRGTTDGDLPSWNPASNKYEPETKESVVGSAIDGTSGAAELLDTDKIPRVANGSLIHVTYSALKTALGALYAPISKGVTNGDAHDHSGGDGGQIAHSSLSGIGTRTHAEIDADLDALEQAVVLKGIWDASAGTFPGGGTAQAGWSYIVSVGGTVDGEDFVVNDRIVAITDNASTTTYAGNWHKLDYTDQVYSVFGRLGAVIAQSGDYDTDIVLEGISNLYHTVARARAAAVADEIVDGVTDVAPSQNAVFDKNATQDTAIAANTAHSTGDGSDHSDAVLLSGRTGGQTIAKSVNVDGSTLSSGDIMFSALNSAGDYKIRVFKYTHLQTNTGVKVGPDVVGSSIAHTVSISGVSPGTHLEVRRNSTAAFATNFFAGSVYSEVTELSGSLGGGIGVFGQMNSGSTPPSLTRIYFSALDTATPWNSYNMALLPTGGIEVDGGTTDSTAYACKIFDSGGTPLLQVRNDGGWAFKGGTVGPSQTGYSTSNVTTTRTIDPTTATLPDVANFVATLVDDLLVKRVVNS